MKGQQMFKQWFFDLINISLDTNFKYFNADTDFYIAYYNNEIDIDHFRKTQFDKN